MTGAIQWLNSNQTLETSPMGRTLNISGKIARFCTIDRASFGPKAAALVIQAVAVVVFAIPLVAIGAGCGFAVTAAIHSFPGVWTAAFLGVLILAAGAAAAKIAYNHLHREMVNEYYVQKEEKDVIEALGGKEAFAKLPRFTAEEANRMNGGTAENPWKGKLVRFKTTDVKAPVTVGVDLLNRPFVCLLVKSKHTGANAGNGGKPFVKTFFLSESNPVVSNCWVYGSNYDEEIYSDWTQPTYAAGHIFDFIQNFHLLEELVEMK